MRGGGKIVVNTSLEERVKLLSEGGILGGPRKKTKGGENSEQGGKTDSEEG